jgi:hypothetical protein
MERSGAGDHRAGKAGHCERGVGRHGLCPVATGESLRGGGIDIGHHGQAQAGMAGDVRCMNRADPPGAH